MWVTTVNAMEININKFPSFLFPTILSVYPSHMWCVCVCSFNFPSTVSSTWKKLKKSREKKNWPHLFKHHARCTHTSNFEKGKINYLRIYKMFKLVQHAIKSRVINPIAPFLWNNYIRYFIYKMDRLLIECDCRRSAVTLNSIVLFVYNIMYIRNVSYILKWYSTNHIFRWIAMAHPFYLFACKR